MELIVVIAIIAALAGLTVGVSVRASQKGKIEKTKARLQEVVTAIEAYKAKKGFYPPDNPKNPAMNSLFYELVGTVYTNEAFQALGGLEAIPQAAIQTYFGVGGILNSAKQANDLENFYSTIKPDRYKEISANPDVEVLVVPVDWPNSLPNPAGLPPEKQTINPWRYNSSSPMHNPGSFDLWAEIVIGNKVHTIGNWKD
jgi:type II secretory pathway pseudopilin PulG